MSNEHPKAENEMAMRAENEMVVMLPVRRLKRHCNPFGRNVNPWGVNLTRASVRRALAERRLVAKPGTDDHAGRIAFLVTHEAPDAIEVDVGLPALNYWPGWMVVDGNHRLAAAIFNGRERILASVAGQMSYAKRLFGVECGHGE